MFLTPKIEKKYGLKINTYTLPISNEKSAEIITIEILLFDEPYTSTFLSSSEFIVHRCLYGEMNEVNYVISKNSIWKLKEDKGNIKIIALSGKALNKVAILVEGLCEEYKITLDRIKLGFKDKDFIKELVENIELGQVENQFVFNDLSLTVSRPYIRLSVHSRGQWIDGGGAPAQLDKIKLEIVNAELKFRIFTKNQWLKWTENGKASGIINYPIKGLEFNFNCEGYKLQYRCGFQDSTLTNWLDSNQQIKFLQPITSIEFKLIEQN